MPELPDVFINYRTDDGDHAATTIDLELSRRFGDKRVFRASKSIPIGAAFPQELANAVRHSSVLLVVIGPRWLTARAADGSRAIDDPQDWTRREILEAFEHGALVVPVLVDKTMRLDPNTLPADFAFLADCQYRRYDHRDPDSGLRRLGDDLASIVPELAEAERQLSGVDETDAPGGGNLLRARDFTDQSGGIGQVGRDVGTFIDRPSGPVHTGSGAQHHTVRNGGIEFHGDGSNYVENGTVNNDFGARRDREGRER